MRAMKAMTVMRSIYFSILISIGVFVVADTSVLHASGPIAAYAIVENVVMEPNDATPDRIQVWGVFMLESSPQSSSYGSPQRGYLYYKLPSGNDAGGSRGMGRFEESRGHRHDHRFWKWEHRDRNRGGSSSESHRNTCQSGCVSDRKPRDLDE